MNIRWKVPTAREPLEAAFALSYEPGGHLKARLLWLGLPERIPISPRVGVVDTLKPLAEVVANKKPLDQRLLELARVLAK